MAWEILGLGATGIVGAIWHIDRYDLSASVLLGSLPTGIVSPSRHCGPPERRGLRPHDRRQWDEYLAG